LRSAPFTEARVFVLSDAVDDLTVTNVGDEKFDGVWYPIVETAAALRAVYESDDRRKTSGLNKIETAQKSLAKRLELDIFHELRTGDPRRKTGLCYPVWVVYGRGFPDGHRDGGVAGICFLAG